MVFIAMSIPQPGGAKPNHLSRFPRVRSVDRKKQSAGEGEASRAPARLLPFASAEQLHDQGGGENNDDLQQSLGRKDSVEGGHLKNPGCTRRCIELVRLERQARRARHRETADALPIDRRMLSTLAV